jgi:hypothetical protein
MVGFLFSGAIRAAAVQIRSIRVNNQPNFPLITAASQKGQMLVMSTLTAAPQLVQLCEVMVPGCPVTNVEGR